MFEHGFPKHWTTLKKLIWLVGTGIAGASYIWKTLTGTLIHITDAIASPMQKCEVTLEPIQDLHGQDAPYPAGGGKNKLQVTISSQTISDVVLTVNSDGTILANGTASADILFEIGLFNNLTGTYIGNGCPSGGNINTTYGLFFDYMGGDSGGGTSSIALDNKTGGAKIVIKAGYQANNLLFKPMIRLSSVTDATFAPHSNICPITGWTGCEVWVKDEYDTTLPATASVTFPDSTGTVYGGTYDFVSGGLKPYKEYDSYNGETLTGEWMSSMDKYVAGTTPTIGAQVVDLDGYDTTVQLTPQPISTLAGENNVWSNGDSVEITYKAQA